jgi:predicted nucleic acid-binding protein
LAATGGGLGAPGPLCVTTLSVVTEACHFLNQKGKIAFLTWILRGGLAVPPVVVDDLDEIMAIIARDGDHEMDFADATLVWLAELVNTLDVMTIDRRDFRIYRLRGGKAFNLVLP